MRTTAPLIALTLALAATAAPARAAQSYDSCVGFIAAVPVVITTQGTWCLNKDLSASIASGVAIEVTVNNVTIDCTGHKLGGLNAGPTTQATGIRALGRSNVTVTGCNMRGFNTAISMTGSGHLVERNRLEGNTFAAIVLNADPAIIRDNVVLDTGLSPSVPMRFAISTFGNVDITGNTIDGVDGFENGGYAAAIFNDQATGNRISGNIVRGVSNTGLLGTTAGIVIGPEGWYTSVRDNVLASTAGAGPEAEFGIVCGNAHVHTRDNQVFGFAATVSACGERDNDLQF